MKIIHVPHPTLRQKAEPITVVDKKLVTWLKDLEKTLRTSKNPQGVGLAAPQVDVSKRAFATFLPPDENSPRSQSIMRTFINPEIVDHSTELTFGGEEDNPIIEGCLSIPHLYGPVPRWQWVELEFQLIENGELVNRSERFIDYAARVVQHEHDHLNGILFTDYSLQLDLPVYLSKGSKDEKMEEIDKKVLESF